MRVLLTGAAGFIGGAAPVARARRVRLEGDVQPGLQVAVDPAGLGRVLGNLIVDGIRYTPAVAVANVGADEAGAAGCRFVVRLPA